SRFFFRVHSHSSLPAAGRAALLFDLIVSALSCRLWMKPGITADRYSSLRLVRFLLLSLHKQRRPSGLSISRRELRSRMTRRLFPESQSSKCPSHEAA